MTLSVPKDPELIIQQWKKEYMVEYNRKDRFRPYRGKGTSGANSIIHNCYETRGYSKGEQVTVPLLAQLRGTGVAGRTQLVDAEEAMDDWGHKITTSLKRNAILLDEIGRQQGAVDQLNYVKPLLADWMANEVRNDTIEAMGSIDGVNFGTATTAQKNTWRTNNTDRILFGSEDANLTGQTTFAASLNRLDGAADRMSTSIGSKMKRLARSCNPKIRPIRVDGGREYYVAFMGMRAFRDLKADPAMIQANRDARARDHNKNPIFQDGDLIYDGIIFVEIPEIDDILLTPNTSTTPVDCSPVFLCGAQAVGHAFSQMPKPTRRDETDYQLKVGRGVQMYYGIDKIRFTGALTGNVSRDWGMSTGWVASPPDA